MNIPADRRFLTRAAGIWAEADPDLKRRLLRIYILLIGVNLAVWAVLLSTVWITLAILASQDLGALLARPGTGELPFLAAVDLVLSAETVAELDAMAGEGAAAH